MVELYLYLSLYLSLYCSYVLPDRLLLTAHRYADIIKTMVRKLKSLYTSFAPDMVSSQLPCSLLPWPHPSPRTMHVHLSAGISQEGSNLRCVRMPIFIHSCMSPPLPRLIPPRASLTCVPPLRPTPPSSLPLTSAFFLSDPTSHAHPHCHSHGLGTLAARSLDLPKVHPLTPLPPPPCMAFSRLPHHTTITTTEHELLLLLLTSPVTPPAFAG